MNQIRGREDHKNEIITQRVIQLRKREYNNGVCSNSFYVYYTHWNLDCEQYETASSGLSVS